MPTTKEQASVPESPPGGMVGDFHRLKVNGAATVAELREFLAQTKGKSPQEVMGLVAGSSLIWSTLLATVLVLLIVAVFTAGPYALGKVSPVKNVAPAAAAKPAEAKPAEKPAETATADTPAKVKTDPALKALEMDEAKAADPKKNPLEGSKELDKLLDKID